MYEIKIFSVLDGYSAIISPPWGMWIARDLDGSEWVYCTKPVLDDEGEMWVLSDEGASIEAANGYTRLLNIPWNYSLRKLSPYNGELLCLT